MFTVDSDPIYIQADNERQKVIYNVSGGTLSYGSNTGVFSEEGTVTVGSSVTLTQGKWFVSASSSLAQEKQLPPDVVDIASDLATHIANTSNPHSVTKTQVGLGNATNTSDANKPVSTAQQTALDLKQDASTAATDAEITVVTANTQTGDYTLVLGDAGKAVEINSGSAHVLTVPTNASVAFPTGTVIEVVRLGAGSVTIHPDTGVTIPNAVEAAGTTDRTIADQYGAVSLRKRGTNEWVLTGDIA